MVISNKTEHLSQLDYNSGQVLLINKDLRWTSFDVVNKIKYLLKHKKGIKNIKVGHGGTLDPLATGLMIVCTGKETKNQEKYQCDSKEYIATIVLGATTPSYDLETEVTPLGAYNHVTKESVTIVLNEYFLGVIMQTPPAFSAKFIDGKRAYELARKGKEVKMTAKEVTISSIEIESFNLPEITLRVSCSKGTYIRSLAHDIGSFLGCGAYLKGLIRTSSGGFTLNDAFTVKEFEEKLELVEEATQSLIVE